MSPGHEHILLHSHFLLNVFLIIKAAVNSPRSTCLVLPIAGRQASFNVICSVLNVIINIIWLSKLLGHTV